MKLNSLKKALAIVMVLCTFFVMFEGVGKVNVEAKTKKVTTSVLEKKFNKAPAVKKGTTKVTMKKQHSYVKFTAPATKTYKITFSNVYDPADSSKKINGYFTVRKLNYGKYVWAEKVKTYGGKTTSIQVANSAFLANWTAYGDKVNHYKTSRTATIKLKKGETIWMEGYFAGISTKKSAYTLKIK
ncbi:hypothetical protein SAMN06297422_102149 [Lachnospiraceae bacterium]|nr:hypothetical protein SAMN06297422_102149 [Lachnospiraceae bacterium]